MWYQFRQDFCRDPYSYWVTVLSAFVAACALRLDSLEIPLAIFYLGGLYSAWIFLKKTEDSLFFTWAAGSCLGFGFGYFLEWVG